MTRRELVRGALGLVGTFGAASLIGACQATPPAAKPAETKPTEAAKPAEAKPTEAKPAAQPAAAAAASPQTAPARTFPGVELRLHVRTGPEEDTLKEVLPKFAQDSGVQVKMESFPTNDYFVKLQTLIAGGTIGDVMWCSYRNTPRFALNKAVLPLDDLIKADNFDLSQYWPAGLDASRYQGALYALPFKLHPGPAALYYNVKQVGEAGLTMPEKQVASWDELIKMAAQLTKQSGGRFERYGLYLPLSLNNATANTIQAITMYARSWGGEIMSEDGKKSLLAEPPARDAIRFMADLMFKHKVAAPGQEFTQQVEDLMIAERAATLQAHSSTKSIPTKIGGKFEVRNLLMPPGPSGKVGSQAITDQIVISSKTKNREAAWELTKLLCGLDVGVRLGGGTGGVASGTCGGRKDVFSDPRLMANPLHPVFIPLVQSALAVRFPANLREEEHATAVHQTLMPVWLGERQPDDAFFTELAAAAQAVLDQPLA